MPVRTTPKIVVSTYSSVQALPRKAWDTLRADPRRSNVILSHAEKALAKPVGDRPPAQKECWITCSTFDSPPAETIDFIISCTNNSIDSYPIFIYSTRHSSQLEEEFLHPRLSLLIEELHSAVGVSRVFSVFAPDPVTQMFTDLWGDLTGVDFVREPYYHATFSICTRGTHIDRSMTIHPSLRYDIRPAVESDIPNVAELCLGFALGSEPFVLTKDGAEKEAELLVQDKQVWVHQIQRDGEPAELASIVCTTRPSSTVTAITKVYTNPKWRKLGCAERFVRRVFKHLLKTKESVVLYVSHNNIAAASFVGLNIVWRVLDILGGCFESYLSSMDPVKARYHFDANFLYIHSNIVYDDPHLSWCFGVGISKGNQCAYDMRWMPFMQYQGFPPVAG